MANGGGSSGRESIETRKITLLSPTSGGVDREGGGGGEASRRAKGEGGSLVPFTPPALAGEVGRWHTGMGWWRRGSSPRSRAACGWARARGGGGGRGEENDKITVAYKS